MHLITLTCTQETTQLSCTVRPKGPACVEPPQYMDGILNSLDAMFDQGCGSEMKKKS